MNFFNSLPDRVPEQACAEMTDEGPQASSATAFQSLCTQDGRIASGCLLRFNDSPIQRCNFLIIDHTTAWEMSREGYGR